MALTDVTVAYSLGVTNDTDSEATLAPVALSMASNYAKTTDTAELARVKNKTTSLEQQEMISYRSRPINKVGPNIPVYNPGPIQDGVLYSIDVQNILRETRSDGVVIDHPIELWLTIKHDVNAAWTQVDATTHESFVGHEVRRLLGACYTDDGVERYDDLAKSALVPTAD